MFQPPTTTKKNKPQRSAKSQPSRQPDQQHVSEDELQHYQAAASFTATGTPAVGKPLDATHRAFFEPLLGANLRQVRIHNNAQASYSAAFLNAKAFTYGDQIVIGKNAPSLHSSAGRQLLAHELIHVVQQKKPSSGIQNKSTAEAEATTAAPVLASGAPVAVKSAAPMVPMKLDNDSSSGTFQLQAPRLNLGQTSSIQTTSSAFELTGFATNSATLTADHIDTIQQIAGELNQNPLNFGEFVTIWGYTDSRGSESFNQQLGQQRADSVRLRLISLVTDPNTQSEIRAYSGGESEAARPGDVPEFRKVTVTVTRRALNPRLLFPGGSPSLRLSPPTANPVPNLLNLTPQLSQLGPPPWLRFSPTAPNRPEITLRGVSEALTDGLRQPLAQAGARAALALRLNRLTGADESTIRRYLDEAIINGGEAGLKQLLRMSIEAIAGSPTPNPSEPRLGPPVQGERIFRLPEIRF